MNATVRKATEDLEALRIRARKIIEEHPTHIPAEEQKALQAIHERAEEFKTLIDNETKVEAARRDLNDLDRYLNEPVHQIPHGINQDDDSRKQLLRSGWEIKGGLVYAPTSQTGSSYIDLTGERKQIGTTAMYPEDVLFGDIPTDDENAAIYYRKTRAIFSPAYGAAFAKYHKISVRYRNETMAFNSLTGSEQKALSEGTDTAGGFIVPPDIQAEMLVRLPQKAIMRQFARVQPTNRDVLRWPAVKANSGTYTGISGAPIYSSGFIGSWSGETPAFSDTDPGFQNLDIAIKKVRVATKLSNDFVSDAAVNIMAFLAQNGAENMALTEDQGFFTGDGSALVPMGILNAGITTVDVEGSTGDTISNTTANAGSAPKLIDLTYKLPPQYLPNARFVMCRSIQGKIRKLVDGNGRYMWPAYTESSFTGPIDTLMGYPVSQTDWMPNDAQDTVPVLVFGDFSHYIIGQRTQITSLVLRERFADTDQVGIILYERVGGSLYNTDAFRTGIC